VPILVADWTSHNAQLEDARKVKPDWYLEEQFAENESPWRHHLRKRRLYVESALQGHLAERGLDRAERLLDLGCGDGNYLVWLASYADILYGSDYNLVRLARAGARSPNATLFLADIMDYPSCDDFFDVIFFNHVIEHIQDDEQALATVFRILRPGGLLILGTPNEGSWWWQLAYKRAPHVLASTDHVHFYTAETISGKMAARGFQISQIQHMGWGPPDWDWDMRLRKYKVVDDAFEILGRLFLEKQASSLYILATKPVYAGSK
jgi:SAM-dependent methyltransferase